MLNVFMLKVFMQSVFMLSVIMLSVIMLIVIILIVFMLNVVASETNALNNKKNWKLFWHFLSPLPVAGFEPLNLRITSRAFYHHAIIKISTYKCKNVYKAWPYRPSVKSCQEQRGIWKSLLPNHINPHLQSGKRSQPLKDNLEQILSHFYKSLNHIFSGINWYSYQSVPKSLSSYISLCWLTNGRLADA